MKESAIHGKLLMNLNFRYTSTSSLQHCFWILCNINYLVCYYGLTPTLGDEWTQKVVALVITKKKKKNQYPKPRSTRAYPRVHMPHKVPHGFGPWVRANGVMLANNVTPEVHSGGHGDITST